MDQNEEKPKEEQKDRGFGRGDKKKGPKHKGDKKREENPWKPVTKLGRLVKYSKI